MLLSNIRTGLHLVSFLCLLSTRLSAAPSPGSNELISRPYQPFHLALGNSGDIQFSHDGHYAAFVSSANNLTANSENGPNPDVFLRDLQLKSNVLITINLEGHAGNGRSYDHSISADGR